MSRDDGIHASRQASPRRGLVVSDLHLFAHRSEGFTRFEALRGQLDTLDLLVLNGDTFDFRWSTLGDQEATVAAALEWLRGLVDDLPKCQVHFVFGNHDCLATFQAALTSQAAIWPRLHIHQEVFRLGPALFLHGDCANCPMGARELTQYRATWQQDRPRGQVAAAAYVWADRLGLTRLAHQWHFPRPETVRRVVHYLDQAHPGWRAETRDCYFGHTHLPFDNYAHEGIRFHNTGSAIRGMALNPIFFELPPAQAIP